MNISILELDGIREHTKAILLVNILNKYSKEFWCSSREMKILNDDIMEQLALASSISMRLLDLNNNFNKIEKD